MDGSHGCGTDLRMAMPDSTGAFFRSSSKQDGTMLLMGVLHTLHRTRAGKWECYAKRGSTQKVSRRISYIASFL